MNDTTTRKRAPGHGGRKPSRPAGARPWQTYCTDAERAAMQATLARMREGRSLLDEGYDLALAVRSGHGPMFVALSELGVWTAHASPVAEEVQLCVPVIGPVEIFDDRSR